MRIISRVSLKNFWEAPKYFDSEQPLKALYDEAKHACWQSPQDIKAKYDNASFLANNRIIFNIHGNKNRLVVALKYEFGIVYVRFIVTHKQYDEIDASTTQEVEMNIKPIKTEQDHGNAMISIEKLWDAQPGTPQGDMLNVLVTLVDAYEQEHFFIDAPDPVEAIKFRMEQEGLSRSDLVPVLGQRSRVTEILGKKRKLSISMIRNLHKYLSIPLESLIADYELIK